MTSSFELLSCVSSIFNQRINRRAPSALFLMLLFCNGIWNGFLSQGSSASFMGSANSFAVSQMRLKRVNKRKKQPHWEFIFFLLLYSFSVCKLANKFTFMNRFWDPEADASRWAGVDSPPAGWHLGVAGGRGLSANRKPAAESHSPSAAAPAVSVSMVCSSLPFWKALTAFIKPNKR